MTIARQYEEEGFIVTEYASGAIVRAAKPSSIAPEPIEYQPSIEEQIGSLKQDNLILMEALATIYEDMLAKGTV
jgi:hypothetical protein